MSVKLKNLQLFISAYQEKSITAAAKKNNCAQPRVSMAIRELEQLYGVKLTEPAGRSVRFTAAARELYRHALPVISLCDQLDHSMREWDARSTLRIGSSISIGTCLLPNLVKKFSDLHPEVDVFVSINSAEIVEQAVLSGELDFALIEGPVHTDRLMVEPYLDDELALVCSAEDPLAAISPLHVEDLAGKKLLLRERNSATRAMAETILTSYGMAVEPAWESTGTTALINGVALGLGVSILPLRFVQPYVDQGKIVRLCLQGAEFRRTYNIIYLREKFLSPSAVEFLRMVDTEERTHFA